MATTWLAWGVAGNACIDGEVCWPTALQPCHVGRAAAINKKQAKVTHLASRARAHCVNQAAQHDTIVQGSSEGLVSLIGYAHAAELLYPLCGCLPLVEPLQAGRADLRGALHALRGPPAGVAHGCDPLDACLGRALPVWAAAALISRRTGRQVNAAHVRHLQLRAPDFQGHEAPRFTQRTFLCDPGL